MLRNLVQSPEVQQLLNRASGIDEQGGDARLKAILRDLLEALMTIIEQHDVSEGEFWTAIKFLQDGASELGLIVPGVGLEHFLDLHMDKKDAEAGLSGGTPRTIEGPLYVEGAPLVEGEDVSLSHDADEDAVTLQMSGQVTGPDGEAVKGAILRLACEFQGLLLAFRSYRSAEPVQQPTPHKARRGRQLFLPLQDAERL